MVSHHLRAVVYNHLQTSHGGTMGLVLPACLPAEMLGSSAVRTSWEVPGVRFCERIFVATSRVVAIINDVANWSRTVMEKLMVRAK